MIVLRRIRWEDSHGRGVLDNYTFFSGKHNLGDLGVDGKIVLK